MGIKIRLGIRRTDGYTSGIWNLFISPHGVVYLASRQTAGTHKISFHKSGICRYAFTAEHGIPAGMDDRVIFKWRRASTPTASSGRATRVFLGSFPTDFLSRLSNLPLKPVAWIDAAPTRQATFLEVSFTRQTERSVRRALKIGGAVRSLLCYYPLPRREALIITYYYGDTNNKDIYSPSSTSSIFPSLRFSANDPAKTGRPFRMCVFSRPKDGDALLIKEIGGYKVD
jgi:hypothetical protein